MLKAGGTVMMTEIFHLFHNIAVKQIFNKFKVLLSLFGSLDAVL